MVALLENADRSYADLGIERRMFARRAVHMRVEGRRLDHSIDARQHPRLSLALRDVSVGGLSAISERPLKLGERLDVHFPPEANARRGWDACGRVIRCERGPLGFRIALEFDALAAAS